jgi:hypothetical protein
LAAAFFRMIAGPLSSESSSFGWTKLQGMELALRRSIPSYQVEDEEGKIHLLLHLPIEEKGEHRWCLWRPDHAGFDFRSIFEGALVDE